MQTTPDTASAPRLRLAFMGTPDFAVPALHALHAAGHDIAAVYCQPPRPAGRGQTERRCPVHLAARALALEVRTPTRLRRDPDAQAAFAALDLDVAVVAAYGQILPETMLAAPRRGCLNIHASLLPRWRGASPINAAIRAGDTLSGVTIMQMEAGLDTGPMLLAEAVPIDADTTGAMLHDRLAALAGPLVLRALAERPPPVPQPGQGVTYAGLLTRADAVIDWTRPAETIARQVRACDPWPGTQTGLDGMVLKVGAALPEPWPGGDVPVAPGTVLDDRLAIACGPDAQGRPTMLRLLRLQRPGRTMLDAADFLRGQTLHAGTRLG